jgi:hypothetical protein
MSGRLKSNNTQELGERVVYPFDACENSAIVSTGGDPELAPGAVLVTATFMWRFPPHFTKNVIESAANRMPKNRVNSLNFNRFDRLSDSGRRSEFAANVTDQTIVLASEAADQLQEPVLALDSQ